MSLSRSPLVGVAAVALAAALWGSTGTTQALLPAAAGPLAVAALRNVFGALTLALLAVAIDRSIDGFRCAPGWLVVGAGAALAAYNLLFFQAVALVGVGVGTAIAIGGAPLWATAFGYIFHRTTPTRLSALGQGLAIMGVGALSAMYGEGAGSTLGLLCALGAGASYAAYTFAARAAQRDAPSTSVAAASFAVAALLTAPALVVAPPVWLAAPSSLLAILFLGVCATGLSYACYAWALTRVAASTAVTLVLIEPLTAWLLAILVVGEAFTRAQVAAAGLIVAGLALVAVAATRASSDPPS